LIVILISGRGSNMQALLEAGLPVSAVISNVAGAKGLEIAAARGVPTRIVEHKRFPTREAFEEALGREIDRFSPRLIALAGFMRILSTSFVERYLGRLLNIHPSILPAYKGLHTHRRVLAAGDAEHGASVHFVTPELDAGPVVLQSKVRVRPGDSEATLAARVQATEHIIYPQVLAWFAQRRLQWHDGAAWLDGTRLETPIVEDFRAAAL